MILSEEQIQIRDAARDFAREQLAPHAAEWDRARTIPDNIFTQMGALGFLGMVVDEQWGGAQTGDVAYALALEEIAAGCGALSTIMSVHNSVGCKPIATFGTHEQKQAYLRKLASGQCIGAFALTEPLAFSDAANLRTRARRDR